MIVVVVVCIGLLGPCWKLEVEIIGGESRVSLMRMSDSLFVYWGK